MAILAASAPAPRRLGPAPAEMERMLPILLPHYGTAAKPFMFHFIYTKMCYEDTFRFAINSYFEIYLEIWLLNKVTFSLFPFSTSTVHY